MEEENWVPNNVTNLKNIKPITKTNHSQFDVIKLKQKIFSLELENDNLKQELTTTAHCLQSLKHEKKKMNY